MALSWKDSQCGCNVASQQLPVAYFENPRSAEIGLAPIGRMKEWRAPLWLDAAVVQDHDDWTVTLRRTGLRTAGLMYSDRAERTSDRTADD